MAEPQRHANPDQDLGLGSRVTQQSRQRFLNRDGSFNVARKGLGFFRSQNAYHWLLTISWVKFFMIVVAAYFVTNIAFAFGYMLCGEDALHGLEGYSIGRAFIEEFFFSVQTLATIGYGRLSPNNMAANILVTFEALVGLLGFAMATGLLFARFSRPIARIIFSKNAVVAPFRERTALMFRIANERSSQLIEVRATVTLSRLDMKDGRTARKFYSLPLERENVVFFPLHWVIVHPIDENSPLHGVTKDRFDESDAEILILLTGIDETFSQTVHARSSYKHGEVVWDAKFADMFVPSDGGMMSIDVKKIHDLEEKKPS
jgi:inward rectifier potassium channel